MMRILITAATVSLSPLALQAQQVSGNALLDACESDLDVKTGFCVGYIAAIVEGLAWGATLAGYSAGIISSAAEANAYNGLALGYCIPPEATNAQVADMVIKRLNEAPEDRHHSARSIVTEVLTDGFPCD